MTQVVLNIDSKKKWNALKTILEAMNIDYNTGGVVEKITEKELKLMRLSDNDVDNGRLTIYTNHREILGR